MTSDADSIRTLPSRIRTWALHGDATDVALVLSVLGVLVAAMHSVPLVILAGLWALPMLGEPSWRWNPIPWIGAMLALCAAYVPRWHEFDNHTWFAVYWTLAVGVCLWLSRGDVRPALATAGRLMIGLIFLLAVLWKATAGEYVSGEFFTYQLLVDARFAPVTELVGAVTGADLAQNRQSLSELGSGVDGAGVVITSSDRIPVLALVMSWWGLAVEAAIALLWLLPLQRLAWLRHAALLLFILTTYLVVPVVGFGCLLIAMAFTQPDLSRRVRITYCCTVVGLLAYGNLFVHVLM